MSNKTDAADVIASKTGSRAETWGDSAPSRQHGGQFALLLLIVAWLPIPIGSNRGWSLAIMEFAVLLLFAAWALKYAWRPFTVPRALLDARVALSVLSLWLIFPLTQLLPLSVDFAQTIGGHSAYLYSQHPYGTPFEHAYLSLDRGTTLAASIRQCALVALLFLVLALTTSASRLRVALVLALLVGSMEALYGLMNYFGGRELGLWNPGQAQVTISGTYVNQNHFAGLLEMTIPIGLGLLLAAGPMDERPTDLKATARYLTSFVMSHRGVVLFCVLLMLAALIMTSSRGGAGALTMGVTAAIAIAVTRKGIHARELKLGLVTLVLSVIAILWLGSGQLSEKLRADGLSSDRGDLAELSYRMIGDQPAFGTGLGTYRWVFPGYKDERFGIYFYEHAHNDYLEVLSEQGIVGFSLLASGILLVLLPLIRAFGGSRDPLLRGTLFATIAGCVSLMVHGLVDFNFQIPANAAYFFFLLGLGTVALSLHRSSARRESIPNAPPPDGGIDSSVSGGFSMNVQRHHFTSSPPDD